MTDEMADQFETESVLENLLYQSSLDQQEFLWKALDHGQSEDLVIASSFLQNKKSFRSSMSAQNPERLSLIGLYRSVSTSKPSYQ